MKRIKKKGIIGIVLGLLLCAALPMAALGAGQIDTGAAGSLSLSFPIEGASFALYRVADIYGNIQFRAYGSFAAYDRDFAKLQSASAWLSEAETLAAYVKRDGIAPTATKAVEANGRALFEELAPALYLVVGESITVGQTEKTPTGTTYHPQAFLLCVPSLNSEDTWNYAMEAQVKYEMTTPGELTDRTVVKVWEGDGEGSQTRPAQITAQLMRNGAVVDEQILNAGNGWHYTWTGLDSDYTWQVIEKDVPQDYEMTVTYNEGTYYIKNSYSPPATPPPSATPTPTPGPSATPVPGGPTKPPQLPQTGQLWWPVPLLAVGGIALFSIGWALLRKKGKSKMENDC